MKHIKKFDLYVESTLSAPAPRVKPGIDTPTKPRPTRPNVIPTEKPGTEDAPLAILKQPGEEASTKDIYNRLVELVGKDGIKKLLK